MRSRRGRVCAVTRQCHCWHSLSRAKTRGGTREGKYSPLAKTLPLRRSNTDCRAGMNREASAAVSADLNHNTFLSPSKWSGRAQNSAALEGRAAGQSLRWGSETSGCNGDEVALVLCGRKRALSLQGAAAFLLFCHMLPEQCVRVLSHIFFFGWCCYPDVVMSERETLKRLLGQELSWWSHAVKTAHESLSCPKVLCREHENRPLPVGTNATSSERTIRSILPEVWHE